MVERDRLLALAGEHGVEPGYHDIWGHWHEASDAALRGVFSKDATAFKNAVVELMNATQLDRKNADATGQRTAITSRSNETAQ